MPSPKDPVKREEWIEKMRKRMKENKYRLGKKDSEETIKRKKESHIGIPNDGLFKKGHKSIAYWKGKKMPKSITDKMSESRSGEKNWNWQGGVKYDPYPKDWKESLREGIRERDNYICFICEIHQDELKRKLAVHHKDYNKDNVNPDNLISLCTNCHVKTNYNREYWIKYFNI